MKRRAKTPYPIPWTILVPFVIVCATTYPAVFDPNYLVRRYAWGIALYLLLAIAILVLLTVRKWLITATAEFDDRRVQQIREDAIAELQAARARRLDITHQLETRQPWPEDDEPDLD